LEEAILRELRNKGTEKTEGRTGQPSFLVRQQGKAFFLVGLVSALVIGWKLFPLALYERIEQPLQFSHLIHTGEDVGMDCGDCHAFREDGSFVGIPPTELCLDCHEEAIGESDNEKRLVEEYIEPGKEIPWRAYARQPINVYFSHASHVQLAEIECSRCHGTHGESEHLRTFEKNRISGYSRDIWGPSLSRMGPGSQGGMKMMDCANCHAERGVVDCCLLCHK